MFCTLKLIAQNKVDVNRWNYVRMSLDIMLHLTLITFDIKCWLEALIL